MLLAIRQAIQHTLHTLQLLKPGVLQQSTSSHQGTHISDGQHSTSQESIMQKPHEEPAGSSKAAAATHESRSSRVEEPPVTRMLIVQNRLLASVLLPKARQSGGSA
jgi:hypothetical protein